jgi:hypothetical protein
VHVLTGTVGPPAPGEQPHVIDECFDSGEGDWKIRRGASEIIPKAARHQLDRGQIFSVEGSAHERLPRRKKQAGKVWQPKQHFFGDAWKTGVNALAAILGCHQLFLWRVHLQLPARHTQVQFESASSPVWAGRSET